MRAPGSFLRLVESGDLEGFARAVDASFFAHLMTEPDDLGAAFAAVPVGWLADNPRYLMADALAAGAVRPYVPISDDVGVRFARWVSEQEAPAARDVLGVLQTRLRAMLAAGRFADACTVADQSIEVINTAEDTSGFDDVLPSVYLRLGVARLVADDVDAAVGLFGDAGRRAHLTGHPLEPYAAGYVALALALDGDVDAARAQLAAVADSFPPTDPARGAAEVPPSSMRKAHAAVHALAVALVALKSGDPSGDPDRLPDVRHTELWWVPEHLSARHSLLWADPSTAAVAIERVLRANASLTGDGTLAGCVLRMDLAKLYLAAGAVAQARAVVESAAPSPLEPSERSLAMRARIALATGRPEAARLITIHAEETFGRRHGSAIAIRLLRAAAEHALGNTAHAAAHLRRAADAIGHTGMLAEVAECPESVRDDLDRLLGPLSTELPRVYRAVIPQALTRREREVLIALRAHPSVTALAAALHISPNTAKTHLRSLYRKLGVGGREEALQAPID